MSERSGILAREDLDDVRRWELPSVGLAPVEETPQPEPPDAPARPTVAELQALQDQARQEGFQRGLDEGREAARRERDAQAARLAQLFNALARPLQDVDAQLECELAELAALIAERTVRRQLELHPDLLVGLVHEAMEHLPAASGHVTITVHPDDATMLRSALDPDQERPWHVAEDASLLPGDCRIATTASRIDLRTDTRLAALIDALLPAAEQHGTATPAADSDGARP